MMKIAPARHLIRLTAQFLANGRLMDEKTGLERARALAQ
jgi:hypothetical protein